MPRTAPRPDRPGVPRLPPAHVPRPRLVAPLLEQPARLRLLCAPAGFGKSVLLSELLRAGADTHDAIAWIGLGGEALPVERLVAQVATALQRPAPDLPPQQALWQLLGDPSRPLWLVLDDYPADPPPELDACIDLLLARTPPNLQLLVSARQRPEWNLPRLLLAGDLQELDAAQLALTRDEQERLVDLIAPQANPTLRDELWAESEGWCAGVRLQLCSRFPPAAASNVGAHHCWLKEYLDHELLARLDDDEARCLFALVHLPRVSAELCQQLWEDGDGAALFARLLARHAFFMPLDEEGRWYRVLPIVARVLRNRLAPAAATHLHLAACRVFIAAGQVEDAIEQALCAQQPEVAANYLEHLGQEWLTGEQHLAHLLAWRDRLPQVLLESTPRLLTLSAWALLLAWRLDEAQACIEHLGRFLPQADARRNRKLIANGQALQGVLTALRGRSASEARQHCREALEHLPERDWMPLLLCHSVLARLAMAEGEPDQAAALLHDALELARRQGSVLFEVLINLDRIRLLVLRGELTRAQSLVTQSFALTARRRGVDGLLLGRLHLIQAELHLLHGRLDEAGPALDNGLEQALACADPFALHGYLGLAERSSRQGEFDQAFLHLREAERQMHCRQVWRLCFNGALSLQSMRVLARQGRWERVEPVGLRIQRYFEGEHPWMAPLDYPTLPLRNQLLLARVHLSAGRPQQAEAALRSLLQRCERLQYRPLACEVGLVLAEAARQLGQEDAAQLEREARQQASALGLNGLLQEWAALPNGTPAAVALLSQREQAVLHLLAEGCSNEEIGGRLFISVNTVKTHTKKINSKLGVKRRTQAVMRAKTLGLLV